MLMYSQDYDQTFPKADEWMDSTSAYTGNDRLYSCPAITLQGGQLGYAYNSAMSQMKLAEITSPESTVLTFDSSKTSRNANDPVTSLPVQSRHSLGNNISYTDGHVKSRQPLKP